MPIVPASASAFTVRLLETFSEMRRPPRARRDHFVIEDDHSRTHSDLMGHAERIAPDQRGSDVFLFCTGRSHQSGSSKN